MWLTAHAYSGTEITFTFLWYVGERWEGSHFAVRTQQAADKGMSNGT